MSLEKLQKYLNERFPSQMAGGADAVDVAINLLNRIDPEPVLFRFAGSVFYVNGLGAQYHNTPEIIASTPAEAQKQVEAIANKVIGEGKWREAKIRPLGPAA